MRKAQLVVKLKSILEGIRVPSLLLSCPTSKLKQFNLQRYSIELKTNVHDFMQRCVYWKDSGHTGTDMRVG